MKKFRIAIIVSLVCLTSVVLSAKPSGQEMQKGGGSRQGKKSRSRSKVNTKWERKADKNNDGVVSKKEAKKHRNNKQQKGNQHRPNPQRSKNSPNSNAVE